MGLRVSLLGLRDIPLRSGLRMVAVLRHTVHKDRRPQKNAQEGDLISGGTKGGPGRRSASGKKLNQRLERYGEVSGRPFCGHGMACCVKTWVPVPVVLLRSGVKRLLEVCPGSATGMVQPVPSDRRRGDLAQSAAPAELKQALDNRQTRPVVTGRCLGYPPVLNL